MTLFELIKNMEVLDWNQSLKSFKDFSFEAYPREAGNIEDYISTRKFIRNLFKENIENNKAEGTSASLHSEIQYQWAARKKKEKRQEA